MSNVEYSVFEYGQKEMDQLRKADKRLGAAIDQYGKVERVMIPDLFTALIHAMVGQLVSVKAAATIWGRMLQHFEDISARSLANQSADQIQECGMTMKKAVNIHRIAQMIAEREFDLEELHQLPDEQVIRKLTILPGVGRWTAEMLLIHAMGRPDVVSWGDLAIRRGMMRLYNLSSLSREQFDTYRLAYSPLGSVASIYLWKISSEQ
ncbi:DNA-3-methyladenine glycosylase 2 family protein [Paenibacillus sp. YPG26]|uniref:DNA-3-methyladenine glycosylase family protein n=1 Tax=Paenibacillus sp. YPG26 TaxID=2878915 RepID=UPI002040DF86|nr:DNA-3-methyladenine glycosylase 2 family protein [Paenibacillus sp. YPG26]USB31766.1 DNA-3-methyladenine glycosylase 2 family protein [Paenibacillus sp. YPG26]